MNDAPKIESGRSTPPSMLCAGCPAIDLLQGLRFERDAARRAQQGMPDPAARRLAEHSLRAIRTERAVTMKCLDDLSVARLHDPSRLEPAEFRIIQANFDIFDETYPDRTHATSPFVPP